MISRSYHPINWRYIWDGNNFFTPYLLPDLVASDLSSVDKIAVPLKKHLVWFEHSGHMPMTEEPGKFLLSYARPIAAAEGRASAEIAGWRVAYGACRSTVLGCCPTKSLSTDPDL